MPNSGRYLLTLVALNTVISPFIADWNETHVYNPRWPPHAKFHNGQTMSMGVFFGLSTLYYIWRPNRDSLEALDSLFTATLLATAYWTTQLSSYFFPGSAPADPGDEWVKGYPFEFPQLIPISLTCAVAGLGYWLHRREILSKKMR